MLSVVVECITNGFTAYFSDTNLPADQSVVTDRSDCTGISCRVIVNKQYGVSMLCVRA